MAYKVKYKRILKINLDISLVFIYAICTSNSLHNELKWEIGCDIVILSIIGIELGGVLACPMICFYPKCMEIM